MRTFKAALLFLVTLAFVAGPAFAPSFRGFEPQDFPLPVSDPPVQPAGYAFSIWLLLYVWLLGHAAWGLWRHPRDRDWDRVRWPLILALGIGAVWLKLASEAPVWATAAIWIMALAALTALFRTPRLPDRWMLLGPIAVLAGWLTAAAAVATGVVLTGFGLASGQVAALACLALVLVIGVGTQIALGRAPEYALALIWALVGVILANITSAPLVATAGIAGVAALTTALIHVAR